jgi:hypothetical protein
VALLRAHGLAVRTRVVKGRSLMAACGQLGGESKRQLGGEPKRQLGGEPAAAVSSS